MIGVFFMNDLKRLLIFVVVYGFIDILDGYFFSGRWKSVLLKYFEEIL